MPLFTFFVLKLEELGQLQLELHLDPCYLFMCWGSVSCLLVLFLKWIRCAWVGWEWVE
jgi:hypothetical protein